MLDSDRSHVAGGAPSGPSTTARQAMQRQAMPASSPACLVAGLNEERRALLNSAATSAGWEAVSCEDALSAQRLVVIEPRQMVIVDLETPGGTASQPLKALCERLGRQKDVLLVVCGNAGNAMEEIWVRQLGAWLYLPGVVDDSDLASLFEEASEIARRRLAGARQQAYFPGAT